MRYALRAKAAGASKLAKRQKINEQVSCENRVCRANTTCIHIDIKSTELPLEVRGKLFLHYHHICAAMGCPHAPIDNVRALARSAFDHISVFPLLAKGEYNEMIRAHEMILYKSFSGASIDSKTLRCAIVLSEFPSSDYPDIEIGLAYLFTNELMGKRHKGPKEMILNCAQDELLDIRSIKGQIGAPIFLGRPDQNRGILVSSVLGYANQKALNSAILIQGIDINVR